MDFHGGEDGSTEGAGAVSVFAPTNKAFSRLPPRLKHFLFSPFGEKALKKLLQFHIIPDAVLHSSEFRSLCASSLTTDGSQIISTTHRALISSRVLMLPRQTSSMRTLITIRKIGRSLGSRRIK